MDFALQWIDAAWLLLVPLAAARRHWAVAAGLILSNMLMMRLLIELAAVSGFPYGFAGLLESGLIARGLVTYGILNGLFLLLCATSPRSRVSVSLAAAISLFFLGNAVFVVVMLL